MQGIFSSYFYRSSNGGFNRKVISKTGNYNLKRGTHAVFIACNGITLYHGKRQ
jgi:hypothetical protein